MKPRRGHHRSDLVHIARHAMADHGLLSDFDPAAMEQVAAMNGVPRARATAAADLTGLPWCSIDNDDSRDLDQLTVAEELPDGAVRVRVAIADVDSRVAKGSPVDAHARHNTTSVYVSCCIFPMLPERLSTDLTSLNPDETRLAVVVSMVVRDGRVKSSSVERARVHNHAKLAYPSVAAWLDGVGPLPEAAAEVPGLDDNLRLQNRVAR